jgi:branched-chain amino acid aminotransferase
MNIMFVVNDTLVTAPVGDTILNGITRDTVLKLAEEWGMKVEVRPFTVKELIESIENDSLQEAFGVGTAATITNIEVIGYRDKDYTLDMGKATFSKKTLSALNELRYGRSEDKFGWNFKV